MGVKQYSLTCWRTYVCDTKGKKHQKYFKTEAQAQAFYDLKTKGKRGNARYKKKSNALNQALPVGLGQTFRTKIGVHGQKYISHGIIATVCINKKVRQFTRTYGVNRSKETAITLCKLWREAQLRAMKCR